MESTRTHGETHCLICQNGYKNLRRIWWMKKFHFAGTHPRVLLVNQLQGREEKWYRNRARTVFILTSRRTKIARFASEPRLQGLFAENALTQPYLEQKNLVTWITADHKVFNKGCESRDNHRYAVVVQDLATQWIQSYPCKTKTSQETERSLQKFLEPNRKPKVIYTNNSLEFGKACEELSWTHCTSTPHRSETNGTAERAVRRVKEGTSAVLLQSGLDDKWWADSMECCCYLRNIQSVCSRTTRLKNNQEKRRKRAFNSQNGKRRQRCCSYYENFTTIGFCLARLRAITTSTRREVSEKPRQKVLGSIRRLRFTQSTLRQAVIRENKGTSLGKTQVKNLHQRSHHAMKFEDRSHEETERQLRCARSKAWNIAKNIYKLKEKDQVTFYSPAEEWVLPAASTKELEERELVVDSGASMGMVSKRDLNSAELETMRTSRSPTTVMTANGEVLTREEAAVYVKELDSFVTVMLLAETPAVPSLRKLCEDHGKTYHWTSGQKPHLSKNGKKIDCNFSNYVPFVVPGFINEFLYFILTNFFNIFIARNGDLHGKSSSRKK